ncbi:hypothetical protein [Bradyrhizobium sp. UNPA324]|nr:hypothetical protein [Bradyrhizobium sp. UNPA324]
MKRLVLQIILRLGRYAILPVVALACTILANCARVHKEDAKDPTHRD